MSSNEPGAMVVQEVQAAGRSARQALRNFNQALTMGVQDDRLEEAENTLHVEAVHYYICLRPWAVTSDYYWSQIPVYQRDGEWIRGLKNLDPWIYSVETVEEVREDAVDGETTETREVGRSMPPQIAARAVLVLDQLFRDTPFSPGQGAAMERQQLKQTQTRGDQEEIEHPEPEGSDE